MGKGRDKRRRQAKKHTRGAKDQAALATERAPSRLASGNQPSDPPTAAEPDAPVYAPRKPRPNLRPVAIAIPGPEPEDSFEVMKPK